MKTSFKALWADNTDSDPNHFGSIKTHWKDTKKEELTEGEVFIKVQYSAINYKDALAVTGKGKILKTLPLIAGIDLSGEVVESKSDQWKKGDPVVANGANVGEKYCGGFSQYARLPAKTLIPRPKNLDAREAAIFGTAGFTAALAIDQMEKMGLNPSQGEVLVTGACGGVGSLCLSFLNQMGYQTEAWTRRIQHRQWLKTCGAHKITDISEKNFSSRPLESATWAGAIDNLGGEVLSYILARMNLWSPVASIGLAKSPELKTSVFPFILRGVSLLGISSNNCPMELKKNLWKKMATTWKPKNLYSIVSEQVHWTELQKACERVLMGKHLGRLLVKF